VQLQTEKVIKLIQREQLKKIPAEEIADLIRKELLETGTCNIHRIAQYYQRNT
jgi:hypothetical protein